MKTNGQLFLDDAAAPILSGHRPIQFETMDEAADIPVPDWSQTFDLLLLEENRIVASTASEGRYAVGMRLFERKPLLFNAVRSSCRQEERLHALPYLREIILFGGNVLNQTDLLIAIVVHTSVKRGLRLIHHCFGARIRLLTEAAWAHDGLRQDDEPLYRAMVHVLSIYRWMFGGADGVIEITTRRQLLALVRHRMEMMFSLLDVPHVSEVEEETPPFPGTGTVDPTHLNLLLLCLALALRAAHTGKEPVILRANAGNYTFCPCYHLQFPGNDEAPSIIDKIGEHPSLAIAALLALRHGTVFSCVATTDERGKPCLELRLSPMQARHRELYTLHASRP